LEAKGKAEKITGKVQTKIGQARKFLGIRRAIIARLANGHALAK